MARNLRDGPPWVPGAVVQVLGPLTYVIQVRGGQRWKRHVDHIREGPSVFSGTQESDSNGPFPPSSNSRPNVELCHQR